MSAEPLTELGRRLRESREKRGWSLQQASERTRITAKNLSALESGDLSRFPAPVYIRGFVRSYAAALGLDEEEQLRWLDAAGFTAPSAAVPRPGAAGPEAGVPDSPPGEPLRVPWAKLAPPPRTLVAGAIVILGVVVAVIGIRALSRWLSPADGGPVPPSPFQQAPAPAAKPRGPVTPPPGAVATPAPATQQALASGVALSVTAHAVCEIQYQPDEKRARWMTLRPGESTVLRAKSQLKVLIGNPGGIEMTTPQGPVPLPKTAKRAEYLQVTAAGVQKLALPVPSSTLQ